MSYEVYLAGSIQGLSYEESQKERKELSDKLSRINIACRNPLRGKKDIVGNIKHISDVSYYDKCSMRELVQRDLQDIEQCSAVVVLTGDKASWGSAMEFAYACFIAEKPTLVICKDKNISGWLKYYATKIVSSIEEAVDVLEDWSYYWNGPGTYDLE
jgi:hypothetical protein